MQSVDDPIVAVGSPPGRSPRGLVRISAPHLPDSLLETWLWPVPAPRRLTAARFRLREGPADLWLPCLVLLMRGPRSYTGQDVMELQVPGHPALLERVVQRLLNRLRSDPGGGRPAEPGEFTRRAFLAGRIDLTRAEGIAATIGAVSDAQLEAARLLRRGRLGTWATRLVDRLAQLLALVEAGIDFVDQEDVVPIGPDDLHAALGALEGELAALRARSRDWEQLEALPRVVLAGRPNCGKSTLFNTLLGRARAVTSDTAGTTRDVLSEPLRLSGGRGGAEILLVDIAGLDRPESALDRAMQEAAREALERAELILLLHDRDGPPEELLPQVAAPVVKIRAKSDLQAAPARPGWAELRLSAATGQGLEPLRDLIAARLEARAVSLAGQMLALQPRHREALRAASEALAEARRRVDRQLGRRELAEMELVAESMREALDRLGALGGRMTPDDVIGRVFATFCVGK